MGSAYAPGLADGFARILEVTANARAGMQPRTRLPVSMLASFVFGWLNTRLPDFRRRYTDIHILVDATPRNAGIRRGEADIAIRYGFGAVIDGLQSEPFLEADLYRLCNPALVNGPTPLHRLKDIDDHPQIRDLLNHPGEPWNAWAPWFALAGIGPPPTGRAKLHKNHLDQPSSHSGPGHRHWPKCTC